jgi:hypothetical protein
MRYPSGEEIRLGDTVHLWEGCRGQVVCSLDTNEFSPDYPKEDWGHLQRGILVLSDAAGLIHYAEEPEPGMALIARAQPGGTAVSGTYARLWRQTRPGLGRTSPRGLTTRCTGRALNESISARR